MIALLLAPVYFLLNGWLSFRLFKLIGMWIPIFHKKVIKIGTGIVYIFFMFTPLLGFMVKQEPFHRIFKIAGNYWLGVLQASLVIALIFEFISLILKFTYFRRKEKNPKRFKITGAICLLTIILMCAYGFTHSQDVVIKNQNVTLNKKLVLDKKQENKSNLKIALISDTHLGYSIGEKQMKKMVDKINESDVDLVVLAGDIFDNDYDAVRNPEKIEKVLREIKSTYGVYACWGNHDIPEMLLSGFTLRGDEPYKKEPRFKEFLDNSNIRLLEDETVMIEDKFYLFGRKDYSMAEKLNERRTEVLEFTKDMDKSKPILMMDHQPRELGKARAGGVDLALSGHTHKGQVFPGNLTVKIPWENSYGLLQKGQMVSCVTSGVGVWGPAMRVGSDAEVMILNVKFKS